MEIFPVLRAICAGNPSVTGEFPAQRPVTRSFHVFFDLRLNKWLSKQSWGWATTPIITSLLCVKLNLYWTNIRCPGKKNCIMIQVLWQRVSLLYCIWHINPTLCKNGSQPTSSATLWYSLIFGWCLEYFNKVRTCVKFHVNSSSSLKGRSGWFIRKINITSNGFFPWYRFRGMWYSDFLKSFFNFV